MLTNVQLEKMINDQVEDELVGYFKYEELMENMPLEHYEHRKTLKRIAEDELKHLAELRNIGIEMGYSEPSVIQALEDMLGIKEPEEERRKEQESEEKYKEKEIEPSPYSEDKKKEKRHISSMMK